MTGSDRRTVLLAVDASTADLTDDDRHLANALERAGAVPVAHRWGDPVDEGAVVVIRSTWDYVDRPAEFEQWLDHLDSQRAAVHNATSTLRWNSHKRYLLELGRAGVPIVPTELLRRGGSPDLGELMARQAWSEVVIKPAIGATARGTVHSARIGLDATRRHLADLLASEDVIVQPYLGTVAVTGETSVVAIAGEPVLAVAKRAGPGEWRVQAEFGGTAEPTALTPELARFAARTLARVTPTPTYARVDLVHGDDGELGLMELELIEPELFFGLDPTLADRLASLLLS